MPAPNKLASNAFDLGIGAATLAVLEFLGKPQPYNLLEAAECNLTLDKKVLPSLHTVPHASRQRSKR